MEDETVLVRFDKYCPKCEYWEKSEADHPCFICLDQGWNESSEKPTQFKPKEEKK